MILNIIFTTNPTLVIIKPFIIQSTKLLIVILGIIKKINIVMIILIKLIKYLFTIYQKLLSTMFFEVYIPYCIVLKIVATKVPIAKPIIPNGITRINDKIIFNEASKIAPFLVCLKCPAALIIDS